MIIIYKGLKGFAFACVAIAVARGEVLVRRLAKDDDHGAALSQYR